MYIEIYKKERNSRRCVGFFPLSLERLFSCLFTVFFYVVMEQVHSVSISPSLVHIDLTMHTEIFVYSNMFNRSATT